MMPVDLDEVLSPRKKPVDLDAELGAPGDKGGTVLEGVFDVLQSGQYASAGFAREMQKGSGVMTALKKAGTNFLSAQPGIEVEGAEKPSFTDVFRDPQKGVSPVKGGLVMLREALSPGALIKDAAKGTVPDLSYDPNSAIDNAGTAIAGFIADVAFDPLTYAGAPLIKAAGRAITKVPGVASAGERIVATRPIAALARAFKKDFDLDAAVRHGDVPAESAEAFKLARLQKDVAIGEGQAALKKAVVDLGASMTPQQRQAVGMLLDQPGKLDDALSGMAQGAQLENLRGKANAFRGLFKEMADAELGAGILSPTQIRAHYLRGQEPVTEHSRQAFFKLLNDLGVTPADEVAEKGIVAGMHQAGAGVPGFAKEKVFETIEDRVLAGVPTELDVALSATQRGLESVRQVATRRFVDAVLNDPGISRRVDAALLKDDAFMSALADRGYAIYNPKRAGEAVYALPQPIVDGLAAAQKTFEDPGTLKKMLDVYDGFLGLWKGYALLSPSWHARNIFGNVFNSWLGGVDDLGVYATALKIQKGAPVSIKLPEGTALSADDLMREAKKWGVVGEGLFAADIPRSVERQLLNEFGSNVWQKVFGQEGALLKANRWLGSHIEDNQRLGHFIGRLQKGDSLPKAAESVQAHLFDYARGLTDFEQSVMKRLIPFYAWAKFNTVLQMQAIIRDPGRYARIPKLKDAIEAMSADWEEDTQGTPDFFREVLATRLPFTIKGRPAYVLPALPAADLNRFTWNDGLASMTPFVSAGAKLLPGQGYDLFSGRPVERTEGEPGVVLPVRRKVESAAESLLPPLGRFNRFVKAARRGDVLPELLAQGAGVRLMPAGRRVETKKSRVDEAVRLLDGEP